MRPERLDAGRCERLADRVVAARPRLVTMERPADVAALVDLFPAVGVEPGHHLDYRVIDQGSAAWIEPFCAPDGEPGAPAPAPRGAVPLHDRAAVAGGGGGAGARRREVDELLCRLRYDRRDPFAAFEYVLFLTELHAFRAEWHAAEWLDSSTVFTAGRLERLLREHGAAPERFGSPPLDATVTVGPRATTVRFPVLSPVGATRVYVYEGRIAARDGYVSVRPGATLIEIGGGLVY